MKFKNAIWRIRYALQYLPFTLHTLLFAAGVWLSVYLLYKPVPKGEERSLLLPFILLMGKMAILVLVGLVAVSVISTFACWVHYLILRNSHGITLKLDFNTQARKGKANKLFLTARLDGAWRPFLGFVKGRVIYDDQKFSDRFSLLANSPKEGNRKAGISGRSRLMLPDIKEYELKGGFVYFQDMLHLFSLAVPQPLQGHFYQPPLLLTATDNDVNPKKTETLDIRIDQLRRVEGEYLNYKDFEAGDDVRRIVWKVYAKNRELVVRVPEMFEPYASHLHLYASFYEDVKSKWVASGYMSEMLNYYKNCIWTVYDTLSQKEWHVSYIPDQSFSVSETNDDAEKTARIISNSAWQDQRPLEQYFNPRTGAVLCISSFVDITDLQNMLERCESGTVVYFIRVSNRLKHYAALHWLYRLVFLPPKDRLSRLRASWVFSPLRLEVRRREKAVLATLAQSGVIWAEL